MALAAGNWRKAQACFQRILNIVEIDTYLTGCAIQGMAQLLNSGGQAERAAELFAFVASWYGSQYSTRRQAEEALREIEAQLPPAIFAAAVARGRACQVEDVVDDLTAR